MKFRVSDVQAERHKEIRAYLDNERAVIAVILAAIDLEWTIRRTIDAATAKLNPPPAPKTISGLDSYAREWKKHCKGFAPLEALIPNWADFQRIYQIRHDIVHGRAGTTGLKYARTRVEAMLEASTLVAKEGSDRGACPFKRLKRRRLAGATVQPKQIDSAVGAAE
jgi:hypothetical protein